MTLGTLVQHIPNIAFVDSRHESAAHSRRIRGVSLAESVLIRKRSSSTSPAGHILIASSEEPWWQDIDRRAAALRTFAKIEAAALIVLHAGVPSEMDDGELRTLRNMPFPVITRRGTVSVPDDVCELVARLIAEHSADAELSYTQLLIDFLRSSVPPKFGDVDYLLKRLQDLIEGYAAVCTPDGAIANGAEIRHIISNTRCASPLERVRGGKLAAAAVREFGYYIQLAGIGKAAPRPVLVVATPDPPSSRVADLITRTVAVFTLRQRMQWSERLEQKLQAAMPAAKIAIHTRLLSGEIEGARKLAESLLPGMFDAQHVQVLVIETASHRCQEVLTLSELAFEDVALVVPGDSEGRIVLVTPVSDALSVRSLSDRVKSFASEHGSCVGESQVVPLSRLKEAHQMATRALAVARRLPSRLATYSGSEQLAHLLDARAISWAQQFLHPLQSLPHGQMVDLKAVLSCALEQGHSGAARHMRLNRKTVRARWKRAEALLQLDLGRMQNRALLDLSLQLAQRRSPEAEPPLRLADLLETPAAKAWARELTAPLHKDSRTLLRTIQSWVACNGCVDLCAQQLDVHPNTVRNHLSVSEELLGRRLVGAGGGAYDLVNALRILGDAAPGRE